MRHFSKLSLLLTLLILSACSKSVPKDFAATPLPSPSAEPPLLKVYVTDSDTLVTMDIESYTAAVVAGEMPNTWPLEALKAQAILARTFVLKFVTGKTSLYPGADISTDIREAQAYDAAAVNDRVTQAVQETTGQILLTSDHQLPYTWFHSHSGGMTETAVHGIDWQAEEPSYTRVTDGCESSDTPDHISSWDAQFTAAELIAACRDTGAEVNTCRDIRIGRKGKSGRAVTLVVDGVSVNAARMRISLGSTKMRSTLLTSLTIKGDTIRMAGRGYGHGVGMSQWGAYALAQQGMSGEEIALHYYNELQIVRAW